MGAGLPQRGVCVQALVGVTWLQSGWRGFSGCTMVSVGVAWPKWVWHVLSGCI